MFSRDPFTRICTTRIQSPGLKFPGIVDHWVLSLFHLILSCKKRTLLFEDDFICPSFVILPPALSSSPSSVTLCIVT
jgi:hypothetical protein